MVRKDLGVVCSKLGQHDKATEQFKQALVLIRGVGDRPMEAETLVARRRRPRLPGAFSGISAER